MIVVVIFFAMVVLVAGLLGHARLKKRLRHYYDRRCTGCEWRKRFPEAKKGEIRDFLALFADAFDLDPKKRLSFSPEDKIMDIYRTIYPDPHTPDGLEREEMVANCEERYGIDITKSCGDAPTLGDIFSATRNRA